MTLGELRQMLQPGLCGASGRLWGWRAKMDEVKLGLWTCASARDAAPAREREPGASLGAGEVINFERARRLMKTAKPNEPPNVPIDEHIGRQLKAIYDDVLSQPIPGRFLDLLNQLASEPAKDEDAPCQDPQ